MTGADQKADRYRLSTPPLFQCGHQAIAYQKFMASTLPRANNFTKIQRLSSLGIIVNFPADPNSRLSIHTLTSRGRCRGRLYPVLVSSSSLTPIASRLSVVCKDAKVVYSLLHR